MMTDATSRQRIQDNNPAFKFLTSYFDIALKGMWWKKPEPESKPELLWWHDQHLNEQNS